MRTIGSVTVVKLGSVGACRYYLKGKGFCDKTADLLVMYPTHPRGQEATLLCREHGMQVVLRELGLGEEGR